MPTTTPIIITFYDDLTDDIKWKLKSFLLEEIKHDIRFSSDCIPYIYYLAYKLKDMLYKYRETHTTIHEILSGYFTLDKINHRTPKNCDPKSKVSYVFLSLRHNYKTKNKKQFIWLGKSKIKERIFLYIINKETDTLIEKINISKLLSGVENPKEFFDRLQSYTDKYKNTSNISFKWEYGYDYRVNFIDVYTTRS